MTPSDLDEIRKRCEAAAGAMESALTDMLQLFVAEIERQDARLALLEPVWEAAKEWRLACARKGSTPEEVGGLWAVFVDAIDAAVAKEGK